MRALLVKDRRLAVAPGTRRVVVFDTETGVGSECCCGGVPNPCCVDTQIVAWGQPFPVTCTTGLCTVCTGNWDRIDIAMSGTATVFNKQDDGSGNANFPIYRVTYEVSHGIFYETVPVPEGDPDFPCKQRQGYSGGNSRAYVETLNGAPRFNYTAPRRIDYGLLAFGEEPGQDFLKSFYDTTQGHHPMQWAVWGGDQLMGFAFDSIERKAGDTGTPGPYFGNLATALSVDLNGNLVKGPLGNQSKNLGGGSTQSLRWNATHTCDGGQAHIEQHYIGPTGGPPGKRAQTDITLDLSWTYTLRDCGAGGAFPGCQAYIAAWLAGDAAADYDGNSFINGDDWDAFTRDHPECLQVIQPGQREAVNRLRGQNRPARAGALTLSDLLR